MPNYWPLSSGNWSNLSNWLTANTVPFNAAILPTSADDVFSNNRIVYIDGNFRVSSIRNISAVNIQRGGYFVSNDGTSLSAYVIGGGVADVACLQFLSAAPASATLVGNLCAGDPSALVQRPIAFNNVSTGNFTIRGHGDGYRAAVVTQSLGTSTNGYIINSSTGTLTISGNILAELTDSASTGGNVSIRNQSSGTINISGNVFASLGGNGSSVGPLNVSNGRIFIWGNVSGYQTRVTPCATNIGNGEIVIYGTCNPMGAQNGFAFVNTTGASTITVFGNVIGGSTSNFGINNNSSNGRVNVIGSIIGGNRAAGIYNLLTGSVFVTGSVIGTGSTDATGGGINNVAGFVSVSGSVFGGETSTGQNTGFGILNTGAGSVTAIGNVFGGTGRAGINNTGGGSVFVIGTAKGGTGAEGVTNTSTTSGRVFVRRALGNDFGIGSFGISAPQVGVAGGRLAITIVEEIEMGVRGVFPTSGNVYIRKASNNLAIYRTSTGSQTTMFGSVSGSTLVPLSSDVRLGTVYDVGIKTGSLAMPSPLSVNFGVPVDNTTGIGVFSPSSVWNLPLSSISNRTTMGGRVKALATTNAIQKIITSIS